jgi:hypothetical protein
MLALPNMWMPSAIAARISLCPTAGTEIAIDDADRLGSFERGPVDVARRSRRRADGVDLRPSVAD